MPDDARPAGGSPAPAEHELLTRLGKYEIERKLGSGGMGTVFLAKDSDLKRTVALKVLSKDKAENPVLVRRFKAEGQAAAYLQHKNIVGVYDSGQIDGNLALWGLLAGEVWYQSTRASRRAPMQAPLSV